MSRLDNILGNDYGQINYDTKQQVKNLMLDLLDEMVADKFTWKLENPYVEDVHELRQKVNAL